MPSWPWPWRARPPRSVRVPSSTAEVRLSYAADRQAGRPGGGQRLCGAQTVENRNPLFEDPFFRRFFGALGGPGPRAAAALARLRRASSTPSGLVVTNNHVIDGADQVKVTLADRREFEADVVLKDAAHRSGGAAHQGRRGEASRRSNSPIPTSSQVGDLVLADRQSVRRRPDRDARHRLGAGAHPGRHHRLSVLHPDRRRHQSRQFRRRAGRHDRQAGRHQHRDLLALGRLAAASASPSRPTWCRSWSPRRASGGSAVQAALARRQAAGGDVRDRRTLRPQAAGRRAGDQRDAETARRRARASSTGDVIVAVDGQPVDDPNAFDYRFATKPLGGTSRSSACMRAGSETKVAVALEAAPETAARRNRHPRPLAVRSAPRSRTCRRRSPTNCGSTCRSRASPSST